MLLHFNALIIHLIKGVWSYGNKAKNLQEEEGCSHENLKIWGKILLKSGGMMPYPLTMAKNIEEELESFMQGEAKLFLLGHFGASLAV